MDGPLPKLCPAVVLSRQDGHHSVVVLLLKAALIQVSDYRLLGASGLYIIFFKILQERFWKRTAILAVYHATNKKREKLYDVYRPNTGRQPHPESLPILQRKYKKVREI